MVIVPINEAEAIIEPFWDSGSSEHPGDKIDRLAAYEKRLAPGVKGRIRSNWFYAEVGIDRAPAGEASTDEAAASIRRECALDVGRYDLFRVHVSMPHWMALRVRAGVDGAERVLIDWAPGADTNAEIDGTIGGHRIDWFEISFTLLEPRPATAELRWLGLADESRQKEMDSRTSPYGPEWPGFLREPTSERIEPSLGLFLDSSEAAELRDTVRDGPLAALFAQLRRKARAHLEIVPEREIGRYVPFPHRMCRPKDMRRTNLAEPMEELALVGLVDRDPELLRHAARMAISIAHCETWSESVLGDFPGATWHHRSFTEERYARATALVLDWAGSVLTPHAAQVIRDAIVMKALPRIESDFKRMEYIRSMNQGIVFSAGRVVGALALVRDHPRYGRLVDEAETDLLEMLDAYVLPDGGTLEGMAYWAYTFVTAMPLLYALARHRKTPFEEYVPESIRRTGEYALSMHSSELPGPFYLPVNDAHQGRRLFPSLAAAFCRLERGSESRWAPLYHALLADPESPIDLPLFFFHPAASVAPFAGAIPPGASILKETGQAQVRRPHRDPALGTVLFHLVSGPTDSGHYHEDKGSFILEAAGEALAIDRGVTDYDHPEVSRILYASRHNLVYPEPREGEFHRQPGGARGARLEARYEPEAPGGGLFLAASRNDEAWEPGLFRRNVRRLVSPAADVYLVDDEIELASAAPVSFLVNTLQQVRVADAQALIVGSHAALRVTALGWSPRISAAEDGVDSHLRPVTVVRLTCEPDDPDGSAGRMRLLTLLTVTGVSDAESGEPDVRASRDAGVAAWRLERPDFGTLRYECRDNGAVVTLARDGRSLRFVCDGGVWRDVADE